MRLLHHLSELSRFSKPLSVALGVFDGVHVGHQAVIREAVRQTHSLDGEAAILTFHPHPAKILRPDSAPPLITTEQQDFELFSALDVDLCVALDFDRQLSLCPAEQFLDDLHRAAPSLQAAVVGPDWHFGHAREGNFAFLQSWASRHSVQAIEVGDVRVEDQVVSSTMVRKQIAGGDIPAANARLGRPYQIVGRVVRGRGIGTKIGFPTANLDVENELIPAGGVYAARALVEGEVFAAAVNIGLRPTLSLSEEMTVEAHLVPFHGVLYGHHVRLDMLARIRDERKFESVEQLKEQILSDIKTAFYLACA
ncbi:MAG: bifunctional riboflavin kinase/FAD synthetase [Verrucomicrobia bacterium]|nr:bifunctional riboflavin kinase/FAD synthetase [Verrucomicrobiota bacterium]